MASPLVGTKLYRPQPRRGLVARPRLSERLERAAEARLTLVSAPAGFGKTTALTAWLAVRPHQDGVAWLSLDEGDAQAASFWTYVITALQGVAPDVGAAVLPLLQSSRAPSEATLATILNELGASPHQLYLVLDDYHLVDGPDIAAGMTFLLHHLPPQAHLVISTRADPDLPLARLRASGDLVEVRAADLRFTLAETSAYVTDTAGLELTSDAVAALETRTEGWVSALQLAALSLEGRPDPDAFIDRFAGDDRYIVDYLVEEVLSRQPEQLHTFLLQTSVLDRLTAGLCETVTGRPGGGAVLEALERQNLFVIPLDDHRRWYRYHQLFADVLQAHLHRERPDEVADLHRRAGGWYEQAGEPGPAVHHALAAGDVDHAADLVELAIPQLRRDRREATIRGWIEGLPEELVRRRPVLAIGLVGALMAGNDFADVEGRLRDVERWLPALRAGEPLPSEIVVTHQDEVARLPAAVQLYRAALALIGGDLSGTVRHAERAIALSVDDDVIPAGASALAGLAHWTSGDLEAAHRRYAASLGGLQSAGHLSDVLGCTIALADIRIAQGRLGDALATYQAALQLAVRRSGPPLRGTPDMHVGIAQIALERGDLETARQQLRRACDLGEHLGLPQYPYRWRATTAVLRESEGDLAAAMDLLDEAQRVYIGDFSPDVRPLSARIVRVQLARGDVDTAMQWAGAHGPAATDDVSYLHEFAHLTVVRVLLAEYRLRGSEARLDEADALLDRLLASAENGGRRGSVIEVLTLQALTHQARGDLTGALARCERALTMARPEGHVRVFTTEGEPLAALVEACRRPTAREASDHGAPGRRSARTGGGLVDPLSARELEVLRLLATDLDGPGIARHLMVSVNTLRTHTKSIYAKLGVTSRRAAVRRAQQLDLLSTPSGR